VKATRHGNPGADVRCDWIAGDIETTTPTADRRRALKNGATQQLLSVHVFGVPVIAELVSAGSRQGRGSKSTWVGRRARITDAGAKLWGAQESGLPPATPHFLGLTRVWVERRAPIPAPRPKSKCDHAENPKLVLIGGSPCAYYPAPKIQYQKGDSAAVHIKGITASHLTQQCRGS